MKIGHAPYFMTVNTRCRCVLPATLSPRGEVALSARIEIALSLRGEDALSARGETALSPLLSFCATWLLHLRAASRARPVTVSPPKPAAPTQPSGTGRSGGKRVD